MADVLKKVPVREQAPKVRATNFDEVCLGYNKEEALEEASRCLGCKKAKCVEGCPVYTLIVEQQEKTSDTRSAVIRFLRETEIYSLTVRHHIPQTFRKEAGS